MAIIAKHFLQCTFPHCTQIDFHWDKSRSNLLLLFLFLFVAIIEEGEEEKPPELKLHEAIGLET